MTTAVVTGGSTGIGLAIVRALLDQGVVDDVVVWDLGHAAEEPLLAESEQVACDVTDVDSVRAAYTGLARPVDILVNKAGGDPNPPGAREGGLAAPDPFGSVDDFRRMVDLNFVSAHVVTSVVGPGMLGGASICNTASSAGQLAGGLLAYGAAKAPGIIRTRQIAGQVIAIDGGMTLGRPVGQ